jgi:hypothetical protein
MNDKWTLETYTAYNEMRWTLEKKFQKERDRRYIEVNREKEKAVKIKETAWAEALKLAKQEADRRAREANELKNEINESKNRFTPTTELLRMMKPINDFMSSRQGTEKGVDKTLYYLITIIGLAIGLLSVIYFK